MKASQRVALEMSTKREALNALLGLDEMSDEQRTEMGGLTTRLQELETEARAAIMAEDVPVITHTVVADGEDRELRSLIDRANVGEIFECRARASGHHRWCGSGATKRTTAFPRMAIPLALLETRAVYPGTG